MVVIDLAIPRSRDGKKANQMEHIFYISGLFINLNTNKILTLPPFH